MLTESHTSSPHGRQVPVVSGRGHGHLQIQTTSPLVSLGVDDAMMKWWDTVTILQSHEPGVHLLHVTKEIVQLHVEVLFLLWGLVRPVLVVIDVFEPELAEYGETVSGASTIRTEAQFSTISS